MKDKRKLYAILIGIVSALLIGISITYSFFAYVKEGSTENTIEQGHLTFLYEEIDKQGNGINIQDAVPTADEDGRKGQAFNFQILSTKSMNMNLPYEITLRQTKTSADIGEIIKISLTAVDDLNNEEIVKEVKFNELPVVRRNGYTERQLFKTEVPANTSDYTQKYRLRMWIASDADLSSGDYLDKTFGLTVNVYANDVGIEDVPVPNDDTRIDRILATSVEQEPEDPQMAPPPSMVSVLTESNQQNVDYETTFPNGVNEVSIDVITLNSNASTEVAEIVGITPLKSMLKNYRVKKLGTGEENDISTYPLKTGDNYFKITVRSANKVKTKDYVIDIYREKNSNKGLSVFKINGMDVAANATTVEIPYEDTNLDIVATPEVETTTVRVEGKKTDLPLGITPIKVIITAEDETTREINIDVIRKQSDDASIDNVGVKNYTLTHLEDNIYVATVPNNVDTAEIINKSTKGATVIGIGEKELDYGNNNFTVTVASQDGSKRIDYIIRIVRTIDTNSKLSSLSVSNCDINFDPDTTEYTCSVANSVESVTVSGTAASNLATVNEFKSYSLHVDANEINILVTAQDPSSQTNYKITVTRARNSNSQLKSLTVSSGTLSPVFNSSTTEYTVTVPYEVDNIDVSAEALMTTSNVSGEGNKILSVGSNNTVTILVTAEDGVSKTPYNITITREQDTDTSLKSLTVTGYSVIKVDNKHYTLTVENDVTEIEISAEANSGEALVTLSGGSAVGALAAMTSGIRTLTVGDNNIFIITVTAQNGDIETYELRVTRKASSDNTLKSLSVSSGTLSPEFNKDQISYTVTVPYSVESITTTAVKNNDEATVTITGGDSLTVGSNNIISVLVKAGDNSEKTYTITVTRQPDTDNTLKALSLTGCSIDFDPQTTSYSCQVENSVTSTTVTATANSAVATVDGDDTYQLTAKSTRTITVNVTAQNGISNAYTIEVYRKPSTDATLSNLTISPGTLSPSFASTTTSYTVSVNYNVTSMTVTPTVNNEEASATVTGGTNFGYGTNTITVLVTAGSGAQKTYTITVTRNKLTAADLSFTSATNPSTNTSYTTCTNVKCALDELYTLTN